MNNPNDNIHTALGIMQNKNVCIWALGRRVCSKSKLYSLTQVDHNWKPINVFATHLGRQRGAANSICTQVGPKHWDLCMDNWNVTSLNQKEQELVLEAEQYHHEIVRLSSTKCHGSDTVDLNEGWKLFYSGVDRTMSA